MKKLSVFLIAALLIFFIKNSVKADAELIIDQSCGCQTSSPSPTASASPSPSPTTTARPTPTETPISCPQDFHLDASGKKCVQFELGGAPTPPPATPSPQVLSASTSVLASTGTSSNNHIASSIQINGPSNIKINKLGLDLAISPSSINGNDWGVFDDRVSWLSTSALPGEGNTILYSHKRQGLFQDLYRLKIGDEIDVYNNKWFTFKVTKISIVNPSDIASIISSKNGLTLFTCFGSFDQKRLVVYAE